MTIPDDRFFDYLNVPERQWELYELYEMMTDEQKAHASRIGAKLWARTELSPAGAFELTMALLSWAEKVDMIAKCLEVKE